MKNKGSKSRFHELLDRAVKSSPKESEKDVEKKNGDCNEKQTHQHKPVNT